MKLKNVSDRSDLNLASLQIGNTIHLVPLVNEYYSPHLKLRVVSFQRFNINSPRGFLLSRDQLSRSSSCSLMTSSGLGAGVEKKGCFTPADRLGDGLSLSCI